MPVIDNDVSDTHPKFARDPLTIKDLAAVLIQHYGFNEGYFDLSVEFNIGVGAVGPNPNELTPGAILSVSRIGLTNSKDMGPMSVDAATVNPKKKPRKNIK
ncbi:MAG: hypothetical protein KBA82_10105 [Nitrosomonas sp.]|nr:hypothetical protein [Nitrosomonas sp.]MBP7113304.1 hypothetical protein [Nitrosomonas sp.]